jgi:hypothetical protein
MIVKLNIVHEGEVFSGEVELRSGGGLRVPTKRSSPAAQVAGEVATKPSAAIELLYRRGYFKEPRRLGQIFANLRDEGYNFSRPSISMALKAAPFVAINGRRGEYEFVQKFPPHS